MNDILRAELTWIEGRCYRIHDQNVEISALQEHELYENEMDFQNIDDDLLDNNFEILELGNGRYSSSFHVSKHYIGCIIGKKGIIRRRIEKDTRTTLKIPRMGQAGNVTVLGSSISNVKAACRRINIIIISARQRQKYTHFFSIPLNDPVIMKNFECFKQQVLQECNDRGVEEAIFIKQEKLHITMGVMCLMDNEELQQAINLLNDAKENIIMPLLKGYLPLRIQVKGLSYMNDDPKNIDVLYGCVQDEHGMTQKLADALVEFFSKAGFVNERKFEQGSVKLHVTLLNTRYRNLSDANDDENSPGKKVREPFDGSGILKKFADFDFGVTEIKAIHLSQRKTVAPDGYYQATCVVPLN